MRRMFFMICVIAYSLQGMAQQGLSIAQLFDGKIVPQERMVDTRVRGKMLSRYKLTYFRSVRFEATDKELKQVRELIVRDRQTLAASQSDENWSDQKTRQRETLLMQLPSEKDHNRYLCYKRQQREVTVVYMEGRLESLETLRSIIK